MAKGNKSGHRRFGNIRRLPSGRYQASYLGPDGQRRNAPETYERKGDADRALSMIEAQMARGSGPIPSGGRWRWPTTPPPGSASARSCARARWTITAGCSRSTSRRTWAASPLGKLSTLMIRQWRATLLGNGVSVSVAAKAYRLLRAVLMTATEDDKILTRNPCRIRGAGDEETAERPVLTVAQVFELAERVGRRPVGNIRKLPAGGYRLRFRRHGVMRTAPEVFGTRQEAERALWKMADDGRADSNTDRRFRPWSCWPRSPASAGAK